MPRPKQRTAALRDRVLAVAVDTLAADGAGGFTTRRVAERAATSTPAVYELFGDKAGLVREVVFEGFRLLRRRFDELPDTADARADLARTLLAVRTFARNHPALVEVMFSRRVADFGPTAGDAAAGAAVREFIVGRVRRCIDAGTLDGSATDIAHALLALVQGLVAQETAGWLGTSPASRNRRWRMAVDAMLDGLA